MVVKGRRDATEPALLRGVLFTLRRKCGKSSCRCATGEAHESPALAYPSGGRTKTMTLTEQDVVRVSAALESYRLARGDAGQRRGRRDRRAAGSDRQPPAATAGLRMLAIASDATQPAVFTGSRDRFESVLAWLEGEQAGALSHGELEERLQVDARALFRQLMQDHLDLRAQSEPRIADVRDAQWGAAADRRDRAPTRVGDGLWRSRGAPDRLPSAPARRTCTRRMRC